MDFVHLHFHTSYSFLDGYNPISKAVARVKELGQKACAITDHNHCGGALEFAIACKEQGIKPILGVELYYTEDRHQITKSVDERRSDALKKAIEAGVITAEEAKDKKTKKKDINEKTDPYMYDTRSYHIILLAKNQKGWSNIVKIQSIAAKEGKFNGRYHCDIPLLKEHSEGVICSTACIGSYPAHCVRRNQHDLATKHLMDLKEIFHDDFYLEIQPLDIPEQHVTNNFYIQKAKELDIKVIATNDVHWTNKEDYDDHDTLLCIGIGKKKSEENRMRYANDFWIKSADEMVTSFTNQGRTMFLSEEEQKAYEKEFMEALANTNEVADKVENNIQFGSDVPLFSKVQLPEGTTPEQELSKKAWLGLYSYLKKHPDYDRSIYEQRLYDELRIINMKGYAPYFLAVEEYVNWANANDCPTGPGRGSAAGSLALFCIGVTKNIDPIQNKLWFSRFLTEDRKEVPDVDIDFSYTKRDSVIHHLEQYYGIEFVSHIGVYQTLKVKNGIKDVCRVLEVPFLEANAITKEIGELFNAPDVTFKFVDSHKDGDENEKAIYEKFAALEKKHPEVFRLARTFEGTPRGQGVHASGILVTPMPVMDLFPLRYDDDGTAITLYTGPQLESLGAVG